MNMIWWLWLWQSLSSSSLWWCRSMIMFTTSHNQFKRPRSERWQWPQSQWGSWWCPEYFFLLCHFVIFTWLWMISSLMRRLSWRKSIVAALSDKPRSNSTWSSCCNAFQSKGFPSLSLKSDLGYGWKDQHTYFCEFQWHPTPQHHHLQIQSSNSTILTFQNQGQMKIRTAASAVSRQLLFGHRLLLRAAVACCIVHHKFTLYTYTVLYTTVHWSLGINSF